MKIADNNHENQQLEDVFREIRLETPSARFTEQLSGRIEKEIRKKERKRKWLTVVQVAAGSFGIVAVAAGMLYWRTGFAFSLPEVDLSFDPTVWAIGLAVLFALIGDSLLRKYRHS
jgi:hypothetical protein